MNVLMANNAFMLTKDSEIFVDWSNLMMITMIDTYAGDAFCIQTKNNTTLIDAGEGYQDKHTVQRGLYLNTLKDLNVQRINNFILTHNHGDHYGSLVYLLKEKTAESEFSSWIKNVTIDNIYFNNHILINNDYETKIKETHNVIVAQRGMTLNLGDGVTFEVLWPVQDYITKMENCITDIREEEKKNNVSDEDKWDSTQDVNNSSIVGRLKFKNFSMLFTGDVDDGLSNLFKNWLSLNYPSDLALYENGGWGYLRDHETVTKNGVTSMPNLESTVYKAAHHGNGHNNPEDIIGYTKAKYAFCSCLGGQDADKTFPIDVQLDYTPRPHPAFIRHVLNSAANVVQCRFYTTHFHHNVTLLTDGNNVWISCQRNDVRWLPRWYEWIVAYETYFWTNYKKHVI